MTTSSPVGKYILFVFVSILILAVLISGGVFLYRHPHSPLARLLPIGRSTPKPVVNDSIDEPTPPPKLEVREPRIFSNVKQPASPAKRAVMFIEKGSGVANDADQQAVTDSLGQPDSMSTKKTANIHNPAQIDEIRTLRYTGLTVTIYHVNGSTRKDIVIRVEVFSSVRPMLWGLRVDDDQQQVIDLFGKPTERYAGTLIYSDEGDYNSVTFSLSKSGNVSGVKWDYYID